MTASKILNTLTFIVISLFIFFYMWETQCQKSSPKSRRILALGCSHLFLSIPMSCYMEHALQRPEVVKEETVEEAFPAPAAGPVAPATRGAAHNIMEKKHAKTLRK